MAYWNIRTTDADLPLMAQVLGISEITAQVLANRGIRSKKAALAYLSPALSGLHDPLLMKDTLKAFRHIAETAARREKIMIYGDYDADGVMSTVIWYKTLRRYGAEADYYIPHRAEEGYGLNRDAVYRMREAGIDLIITVDNGISALAEIAEANALGMRVIVVDHHEPGFVEADGQRADVVPDALAVIDPKQAACPYPFKHLCAAGLSFRLADAFCRYAGIPFSDHDELLALAAIATICDIVDLQDENRVLVKHGLAVLNTNKLINPGLGSLILRRGYLDKPVDTFVAGFILGPCINATGRLQSAALSVQLMLAPREEERERTQLADKLTELNEERKNLTAESVTRALSALPDKAALDKVLVLVDTDTHESIAGIVAGRVKDTANRPTLLLTRGDSAMKGSGRSIEGYNLFEALYRHRDLFLRFGGHAMAAGLTMTEENIAELRTRLNDECTLTEDDFHATLSVDRQLKAEDVTLELAKELAWLAPFGKGNREPLFVTYGLTVESLRVMDEKNTLIFTFVTSNHRWVKGICFGMNEAFAAALEAIYPERECRLIRGGHLQDTMLVLDAVYGIDLNTYNGQVSVQMRIKDFVLHKGI